jgi:hypothetical protein
MIRIEIKGSSAKYQQRLSFLKKTHDSQQFFIVNKIIAFGGIHCFRVKCDGMPVSLRIQLG